MSSSTSSTTKKKSKSKLQGPGRGQGVDSLLKGEGKKLTEGQEVRFTLVKGPNRILLQDPVNKKAPSQPFPLVAKFSESVVKPNFAEQPWKSARLYQQDIPRAVDDSDEEEDNATDANNAPKKRWRARNQKEVGRQWILQEQVEFLEGMMSKRQKLKNAAAAGGGASGTAGVTDDNNNDNNNQQADQSTKYAGMPEHNSSRYILLETTVPAAAASVAATANGGDMMQQSQPQQLLPNIQVTVLPTPFATINFSQPNAHKAFSMSQAADIIDERSGRMAMYMMQDKQRTFEGQATIHQSRSRLEAKLRSKYDDDINHDASGQPLGGKNTKKGSSAVDEDDVMADIRYEKRGKGSTNKARQELLSSFGDAGTKVDADFVLGGTNDAMFGTRGQRFAQLATNNKSDDDQNQQPKDKGHGSESAPGAATERGNDGLAMADDFYQRDVKAEYEELDYDANEQFDDDDVDVGETEIVDSNPVLNQDDDEEDFDDELDGEQIGGAEGLANAKELEILLRKARGELTAEQAAEERANNKRRADERAKRLALRDQERDEDHLSKVLEAAGSSDDEATEDDKKPEGEPVAFNADEEKKFDDNGDRIISLNQVRREIWLNHNRIAMKRLLKIFNIKKGKTSPERVTAFTNVTKELCILETDATGQRVFILKQHFR